MKRIQVKFVNWMEFKVKDDFDVNSLGNVERMALETMVEITGDDNWEHVELEDYYQDVRFIGDQIWFDDDDDCDLYDFDESSQSYKRQDLMGYFNK